MSKSNEVFTDPRLEKRSRRRFSVAEKVRLLKEADALAYGQKGAWLRRNGLYAGQLSTWRKELTEHGEAGLATRKPGRRAADSRDKEIERLHKVNARLEHRAYVAEQLVDLQKKSCACSTCLKPISCTNKVLPLYMSATSGPRPGKVADHGTRV